MESPQHEDIFNTIANLVITSDFLSAQSEFYEKHKDTFEDSEENKLEYT